MQHYTRIRDLREDCDLTQEKLSKKLYMHKTTYTNYEQGKHMVPLDFAVTLSEFYDVSLDYLAGRTNNKRGIYDPDLTQDEMILIEMFRDLSERNKGKIELYLEQLHEAEREVNHEEPLEK